MWPLDRTRVDAEWSQRNRVTTSATITNYQPAPSPTCIDCLSLVFAVVRCHRFVLTFNPQVVGSSPTGGTISTVVGLRPLLSGIPTRTSDDDSNSIPRRNRCGRSSNAHVSGTLSPATHTAHRRQTRSHFSIRSRTLGNGSRTGNEPATGEDSEVPAGNRGERCRARRAHRELTVP
jgi:hypothetical protein